MNCFKIAMKLLKNNFKMYKLYLMVIVVNVATYYNFVAMRYNNTYEQLSKRLQATSIVSMTCGFVLICTVISFMWYSNGFFLKQRQKETGLYMLMGISSSKIGKVFAIETTLLGLLSLILGLPIGILFSKLFFMILGKAMFLNAEVPFNVSLRGIVHVVIVFFIIFIILSFKNYLLVKRSKLINMLNATKKNSSLPKLNYPKAISGIILIIVGYIIGINIRKQEFDLLIASMSTLIMVCLGTYLLFGSLLTIILSKFIKNKNILYKKVILICISNIFFRLKSNYRTLAMTAILAASTVTAISISVSFKSFADDNVIMESPYSFSYISDDAKIKASVLEVIGETEHRLIDINEMKFFIGIAEYLNKDKKIDYMNQAIVTSYSQIEKTLEHLKYENRKSILEKIKPKENEATFILNANTISTPFFIKGEQVKIKDKIYNIKEDIKVPFTGSIPKLGNKNIYVFIDREYERLKTDMAEITLNGVKITKEKESEKLVKKIAEIVPGKFEKTFPHITQYVWEYYALGMFFFLGLFMSMVFMLATFSTLYFKILSNALMDREEYKILKKVGMSREEVGKAVYIQLGIEFLLPTIIGIIHSVVAMRMVEQILNAKFILQIISGIGLFTFAIIIFYLRISKHYVKIVYR